MIKLESWVYQTYDDIIAYYLPQCKDINEFSMFLHTYVVLITYIEPSSQCVVGHLLSHTITGHSAVHQWIIEKEWDLDPRKWTTEQDVEFELTWG